MKTLVVVPMKDPFASKTRLQPQLGVDRRAALARLLFARSIEQLSRLRSRVSFDLAVVTASAEVKRQARRAGTGIISDPGEGLNAALEATASAAFRADYERLCVLPADLAAPRDHDLIRVIGIDAPPETVLICPATDGGTNALRMTPKAMPFAFGNGSAAAHIAGAEDRGLCPVVLPLESLAYDIDTAADLARAATTDTDLQVLA